MTIEKVNEIEEIEIGLIVLTFRDAYLGRGDMYHIKLSLMGECVYLSKNISFSTINLTVQELTSATESLTSGIVTENTKVFSSLF